MSKRRRHNRNRVLDRRGLGGCDARLSEIRLGARLFGLTDTPGGISDMVDIRMSVSHRDGRVRREFAYGS